MKPVNANRAPSGEGAGSLIGPLMSMTVWISPPAAGTE